MLYGVFHHIDYIDLRSFRQRIIEEFTYLIVKIVSTFGEITKKYTLHYQSSVLTPLNNKKCLNPTVIQPKKGIKKRKAQLCVFKFTLKNFFNFCSFTRTTSEIVEFSSSDFTATDDVNFDDLGRMDGESSFHTDTERKSSYGKGFAYAAMSFSDNYAFENLNSGLVAFDNFKRNLYGVADVK